MLTFTDMQKGSYFHKNQLYRYIIHTCMINIVKMRIQNINNILILQLMLKN